MAADIAKIGILDSGVGGVSIYNAVRSKLPELNYFYCSDSANFPYGTKAENKVVEAALEASQKFIEKYQLDILVVACNTASTVALAKIRESIAIPVIGVVPAIKPAAAKSKSKVIGLLATPGTIGRNYTEELIQSFAASCEVIKVGSSELVQLAEDHIAGKKIDSKSLQRVLLPFKNHTKYLEMDHIVLGCTHFPLVAKEVLTHLHEGITLVDSGEAIASRVLEIINHTRENDKINQAPCKLFFTHLGEKEKNQAKILGRFSMTLDS